MIKGKYSAVIGWKTRAFVCVQSEYPGCECNLANHSAAFGFDHQDEKFRQIAV